MHPRTGTAQLRTAQYGTAGNFNARVALHQRFRTNPYGLNRWLFDRMLRLPDDSRILEIGCGPGWLWRGNSARIPPQWAVMLTDFSVGMIREARSHLGDRSHHATVRYAVADAQSLPSGSGRFDAVIANYMLYHVPDRERTYTEITRVLRPGGRFFASTFGTSHMHEMAAIVSRFSAHPEIPLLPQRFLLENGQVELARRFANVTVERYPDSLDVTEAEPFVAYVRSRSRSIGETAADTAERLTRLSAHVAAEIAAHGRLHISTDAGLLTAIRP
jgi:SAM-dependent methyltransferase